MRRRWCGVNHARPSPFIVKTKFPTGTPKECQRMVVDGGSEQSNAVVFFTTVPFLAGVVLSVNV